MPRSMPGADMVGFVFFPPSPRHLALDTARALGRPGQRPRAESGAVGRRRRRAARAVVAALQPDLLQLHGKETPERVAAIKARFRLPVMKAIAVETRGDLAAIARLCRGRRPPVVRRPGAARGDPAGRSRQAVRLAPAAKP